MRILEQCRQASNVQRALSALESEVFLDRMVLSCMPFKDQPHSDQGHGWGDVATKSSFGPIFRNNVRFGRSQETRECLIQFSSGLKVVFIIAYGRRQHSLKFLLFKGEAVFQLESVYP